MNIAQREKIYIGVTDYCSDVLQTIVQSCAIVREHDPTCISECEWNLLFGVTPPLAAALPGNTTDRNF